MSSIEEYKENLENCTEDSEVAQIIDAHFKEDPLLKFEVFPQGVSFTYNDLSNSMASMYISPIRDGKEFLISQMYPYWYDKGLSPYDKITRMVVSHNGWGNIINMFKDRVIQSGKINPETEKHILKPVMSKITGAEKLADSLLMRADVYLHMLLEMKKLSPKYSSKIEHFRGNISMCGDCEKYLPIWNGIKDMRKNGFVIKRLDFKGMEESSLPRYNHLPKIVFDN